MKSLLVLPLALVALSGCRARTPAYTIEIIDTSLSITPRAEKAAFDAVGDHIRHMERSDRLVVIPVTGDAENDAGGHILHLEAPTVREAYDTDLRRFRTDAERRFSLWASSPQLHGSQTDILGALDTARQELAAMPRGGRRILAVASDFLEDDGQYRFISDRLLLSTKEAHGLAVRIQAAHSFHLHDVSICLGRLESRDFVSLSPERREAVRTFWRDYLAIDSNVNVPDIRIDGTGMLGDLERGCVNGTK